jgi:2-polyprenyl-3-methyl-5-hydroxy-6-metoxy-1,4-benzoquinol methylase
MDNYKETFETWNKVAKIYEDKFMYLDLYNETYDVISNTLSKPNSKILDIGCGPGNIMKYLLTKRPDYDVLGVDVAPKMIELAKANNPTANFKLMDIRQIDDLTTKFDGVVCGFCLPFLSASEGAKLIADCCALLNKKGLIYLSFMEGDPSKSGFQISSTGDRAYFFFHELDEIKKQLELNSFSELKVFKVTYQKTTSETQMHTILIAQKV